MARPKENAIGTPDITASPRKPIKNTSSDHLPIAISAGAPRYRLAAMMAMSANTLATSRQSWRIRRRQQLRNATPQPTGSASARTDPDQPSAGVSTKA